MSLSILEFLKSALAQYGYWTVAATLLLENAGIPVPGETVLLLASFLCYSEHRLQLPWLIAVATLAATAGDNIGFALGYYGGRPMLNRYQSIFRIQKATLLKGERLFTRYGPVTVFFARFVFGMRIITGPLAGVLRMPWRRFMIFNFLGAGLWVAVISSAGFLFGRHWQRLQENVKRFDTVFAIFVLLLVILVWWRSRRQNKAAPLQ